MAFQDSDFYPLHDFRYKGGDAYLFPFENRWYVLYEGIGPGMKNEVLIFDSDKHGRVTLWDPIASASGMSRKVALDELQRKRAKTYGVGWPE